MRVTKYWEADALPLGDARICICRRLTDVNDSIARSFSRDKISTAETPTIRMKSKSPSYVRPRWILSMIDLLYQTSLLKLVLSNYFLETR